MSTTIQHDTARSIGEKTYDMWGRGRRRLGMGIDAAVTNPLYRLTGWIAEGHGSNIEDDAEAAFQMGVAVGKQTFTHPTREQVVTALRRSGVEASDERMANLGFANYPTARQRMEATA